ncbi:neutral zinc metallopeptidase [Streptosporangium jomthongense]|uniref:Neutral zinc metallopeptidase n=1 Tax=Streptosporangium jomthongense TaxID=1193683 RepID=A0ABV8F4Z7_9ACTN
MGTGLRRRGIVGWVPVVLIVLVIVAGAVYIINNLEKPAEPVRAAAVPMASTASPTPTPTKPAWLRVSHKSYRGLGPMDASCDLPGPLRDSLMLGTEPEPALRALALCLDRMWADTLAKVGVDYVKPEVRLVHTQEEAACASLAFEWGGIYCPGKNVINVMITDGDSTSWFTLAHEYAHHAQFIGAITDRWMTRPRDDDIVRRSELQASCLAAVTLRTALPEELEFMRKAYTAAIGSKVEPGKAEETAAILRTHGSWAHNAAWIKRGERQGTVASCDTWVAPARQVS